MKSRGWVCGVAVCVAACSSSGGSGSASGGASGRAGPGGAAPGGAAAAVAAVRRGTGGTLAGTGGGPRRQRRHGRREPRAARRDLPGTGRLRGGRGIVRQGRSAADERPVTAHPGRAAVSRSVRRGRGPDVRARHRAGRLEQHHGRIQRPDVAAGPRQRLRGPPPGHPAHGQRDRHRRHVEAARPVVVGADRHARRRARQDPVRHLVPPERPERQVPRCREAGVRHAPQRLDVHARPAGPRLVPAGGDRGRLRRQRARRHQRRLLRPLRRRGEHQQARAGRVLPRQHRWAVEGRPAARNVRHLAGRQRQPTA